MKNQYEPATEIEDDPEPDDRRPTILTLGAILFWVIGLATLAFGASLLGLGAVFVGVLFFAGRRSLGDK